MLRLGACFVHRFGFDPGEVVGVAGDEWDRGHVGHVVGVALLDELDDLVDEVEPGVHVHALLRFDLDGALPAIGAGDMGATVRMLLGHKARTRAPTGPRSFVFATRDGKPLGQRNLMRVLYLAQERARDGSSRSIARALKNQIVNHGVRWRLCRRAKSAGSWRCSASDTRQARHADEAGVRRDQHDRRGEQADVRAGRRLPSVREPELGDDPEHRIVLVRRADRGVAVDDGQRQSATIEMLLLPHAVSPCPQAEWQDRSRCLVDRREPPGT